LALVPLIGGALVVACNWRALFWFILFFGLAALILGALVLPESADPAAHRVDTAGALLGAAVLATLMFAIIDAETAGFAAPLVIALFCVSAAAAAAFGGGGSRGGPPPRAL